MTSFHRSFLATVALVLLTCVTSFPQNKPTYQTGTVMEVKPHQPASDTSKKQYDLSVKVGDMLYTVLFTSAPGSKGVEYSAGMDRPVLVQSETMKFSDLRGNTVTMPILSRKHVVSKKETSSPAK